MAIVVKHEVLMGELLFIIDLNTRQGYGLLRYLEVFLGKGVISFVNISCHTRKQ